MIRGLITLMIVGAVVLGGVVVVKGPQSISQYLPERMAAALDRKTDGADGAAAVSGDSAADYLDDGVDGLSALGPIAAMAGNRPVLVDDVLSGHSTRVGDDIPAEITMIRPISGCKLTPPLEGTAVGHVTATTTGLALPLLTYNDVDLAGAVQALVNSYRDRASDSVVVPKRLAYETYDVAVTETRAPVYLVLESGAGNRIWNISLAPGAQVERVVLLGATHVGVANLDPVVPVEVVPGSALADCGIAPAYPLNPGHALLAAVKSGQGTVKTEAEADYARLQDRIAAYNIWFRDSFGVLSEESRAGFDVGGVSVVGPQPGAAEPKAVYASVEGSRIRMTQDSYFEITGQAAKSEDFAGRVKAITSSFAFGDLKTLRQGAAF